MYIGKELMEYAGNRKSVDTIVTFSQSSSIIMECVYGIVPTRPLSSDETEL